MSISSLSAAFSPLVNPTIKEFSNVKISHQLIKLMGALFQLNHKQQSSIRDERSYTKELQHRVTKEETLSYRFQAASHLLQIPSSLSIGPAYKMAFKIGSDSSSALFQGAINAKRFMKEEAQLTLSELAQNSSTLNTTIDKLMEVFRQVQQHEGVK